MKLKYNKINNIDLTICTAEQVTAYNIAFDLWATYGKGFIKQLPQVTTSAAFDAIFELIRIGMKNYTSSDNYKPGQYNLDAINAALNAGLYNYFVSKHHTITSYTAIGDMFPAYYL